MLQIYKNNGMRMEAETITKNVASLKSLMSRGNVLKILLMFELLITGTVNILAQNCSAKINNVWTEYNVYQNEQQGIKVHCNFTTNGMQNKEWTCGVMVYYKNGQGLANNGRMGNYYFTYQKFYPGGHTSTTFKDFVLFMPNDDFKKSLTYGNHNLQFTVLINCEDCNVMESIASSDWVYFSFNNPEPQYASNNTYQNYQPQDDYPKTKNYYDGNTDVSVFLQDDSDKSYYKSCRNSVKAKNFSGREIDIWVSYVIILYDEYGNEIGRKDVHLWKTHLSASSSLSWDVANTYITPKNRGLKSTDYSKIISFKAEKYTIY